MPKVAAVQIVSSASVENNLKQVEQFFIDAREKQIDLLVLPENFAFMGVNESDKLQIAEKYGQEQFKTRLVP